jgi:hypothetical protein
MSPELEQRLRNVVRVAKTQRWDEWERIERDDGWLLKFRPAGQLDHPDVLPTAITQLSLSLAPFQTRLVEYLPPDNGGPVVTMLVPSKIAIVTPPA